MNALMTQGHHLMNLKSNRGVTMMELLTASVIAAFLAGGTMIAFLAASKLTRQAPVDVEAVSFAQQTLEGLRNRIACNDAWFDPSTPQCDPDPTVLTGSPQPDGLPASALRDTYNGTRTYTVTPEDCDGDGTAGDCFKVKVTVSWNRPS